VTTQIKYLTFKGVEKKEQILFKSFLNLAKNELEYQVVMLKPDQDNADDTDIVIRDENYDFEADEEGLRGLPTITVGENIENQQLNYICRPIQWSDFKVALSQLDIKVQEDDEPVERVLPSDIKFAISDMADESTSQAVGDSEGDEQSEDADDYEYELGKMSVDYHSFTNSDYMKVVDDVEQFKDVGQADILEPVILVTDDESASSNSVLVIETDSHDAWDFSQSEISVGELQNEISEEPEEEDEVVLERKVGLEVAEGEEYWLTDNEIIVDHKTLLYIKPQRSMIYSEQEPGRWTQLLQQGSLSKLPLHEQWRPSRGLKAYPMSSFSWVNALISQTTALAEGLDENTEYMLEKWPHFDLIELDNVLLKLCTMLFVRPETVESLCARSGYGRAAVIGLINACHTQGLIKPATEVNTQQISLDNNDQGMFGRIKDAFR